METGDPMDLALWRYGIISPLLHRQANETQVGELLDHLAGQNYVRPDGAIVTLSAETIRKWLYRYNRGGLPAMGNKQRSDKGRYDVPAVLSEAIHRLRQEHPGWTLALILNELMDSGLWNGLSPSRSTMYRFASARNLRRNPDIEGSPACRSFSFTKFGQLWTADFLHGPRLKVGKQKKKTYLHAIMDDASRYVVGAGFYHNENLESLIGELMKACRTFGLPQRLYTDNGAAYSSRHLKIVTARLGVHLIHTPARRPQGRAKVERFFRTVRDQLLAQAAFPEHRTDEPDPCRVAGRVSSKTPSNPFMRALGKAADRRKCLPPRSGSGRYGVPLSDGAAMPCLQRRHDSPENPGL